MLLKLLSAFACIFTSNSAIAAGGFTWLSSVAHAVHQPEHTVTLVFVTFFIITIGLIYRSKLATVENVVIPDKGITLRNCVESYGQFIMNQCKATIGEKEGPKYFIFISMVFLFILFNNLIGLIPGFLPPTENLNTTLALGAMAFIYYNIKGCKELGVINYLKHFCGPLLPLAPLIFAIEIISNFVRPLSLALRLKGNMQGDHLVLGTFTELRPEFVPMVFLALGLLVCVLQAYVFTMLTMVYISLATSHHDDH